VRVFSVLPGGLLVAACTSTLPPNRPSNPPPQAGAIARMPSPAWSRYENPKVGFVLDDPPGWAVRTIEAICHDGLFTHQGVRGWITQWHHHSVRGRR
jgi:hypothetical protein